MSDDIQTFERDDELTVVPISLSEQARVAQEDLIDRIALEEAIVELERTLMGQGWERLSQTTPMEFSRDGLTRIVRFARLSYLKNPLIRHAVELQADYVFAMGVSVRHDDEAVNAVIQGFWDDPKNKEEFTDAESLWKLEVDSRITGNIFLALFTQRMSGRVVVRSLPIDEIIEIICNPEDVHEPWFYKRVWNQDVFDFTTGTFTGKQQTAYYPDWRYEPEGNAAKVATIGAYPVFWDTPIMHVKVGGLHEMKFGVPDIYSSLDWAKAVKEDLEDYVTVRHALAKFAWRFSTKGGRPAIDKAKAKFATAITNMAGESNPPPVKGSIFVSGDGNSLDPIRTAGSAPNPEESRRLWLMTGAGVGLPETMLSGDTNVGNLATATSLDRPTELRMISRRNLWTRIIDAVVSYVIRVKVNAGKLGGVSIQTNTDTGEQYPALPAAEGGEPQRIHPDVTWPPLLDRDPNSKVGAIISAVTLDGKTPVGTVSEADQRKMLLTALGEDDVDEMIERAEKEQEDKKKEEAKAAEQGANTVLPPAMVAQQPNPGEQPPGAAQGKAIKAAGKAALGIAASAHDGYVAAALEGVNAALLQLALEEISPEEVSEDA